MVFHFIFSKTQNNWKLTTTIRNSIEIRWDFRIVCCVEVVFCSTRNLFVSGENLRSLSWSTFGSIDNKEKLNVNVGF